MSATRLLPFVLLALLAVPGCQESSSLFDFDEDGSSDADDCAPSDPAIHPGAAENCFDEIDNDCDGRLDCADGDCREEQGCPGDDDDAVAMVDGDDDGVFYPAITTKDSPTWPIMI